VRVLGVAGEREPRDKGQARRYPGACGRSGRFDRLQREHCVVDRGRRERSDDGVTRRRDAITSGLIVSGRRGITITHRLDAITQRRIASRPREITIGRRQGHDYPTPDRVQATTDRDHVLAGRDCPTRDRVQATGDRDHASAGRDHPTPDRVPASPKLRARHRLPLSVAQ
jgi:hypothetical protein